MLVQFKANKEDKNVAGQVKIGECFMSNGILYMRIYPVDSLLNSHLIRDVVTRDDVFSVRLDTGIFTVFPQIKKIKHAEANIIYSLKEEE